VLSGAHHSRRQHRQHLAPATLAPAVATARTTALATSDSRHHALAPGAVRRTQDTETSPATMRQSPPAIWKNRGKPSSTGSPSPDDVVADGFMRMDPGQAKHETAQTCEPYTQGLPLAECGLLASIQLSRKRRWVRLCDEKAASRAAATAAATAAFVAAALANVVPSATRPSSSS
jgi:hypothetical protein